MFVAWLLYVFVCCVMQFCSGVAGVVGGAYFCQGRRLDGTVGLRSVAAFAPGISIVDGDVCFVLWYLLVDTLFANYIKYQLMSLVQVLSKQHKQEQFQSQNKQH